jgi:uncharacterized protein (DUF3084 family)
MVAQNLTRFTLVMVLVGVVLSIAVFRPQILPSEAGMLSDATGQVGKVALVSKPNERTLALRWEEVQQRERELDDRENDLGQRQKDLDERDAALDSRAAKLEKWAISLQAHEENLAERDSLIEEEWSRLREAKTSFIEREVKLAEREQKLQGFLRWSGAAMILSGLMAVPSIMVLVALRRQDRQAFGKGARLTQASGAHQRRRTTQPAGMAPMTTVPTHGGNGRTKESVAHRV